MSVPERYIQAPDFDAQLTGVVRGYAKNSRSERLVHDGTAVNYSGIGDTFIGTCEDGTIIMRMPETFAADANTLDMVSERETELKSVIFVLGEFVGGVDIEGVFRPAKAYNISEYTPETIQEYFSSVLKLKSSLADQGIMPIFEPAESFDPISQKVEVSTKLGGLALSGMLRQDPELFADIEVAIQQADLAERLMRPKYSIKVDHHNILVSDVYNINGKPAVVVHMPEYMSEDPVKPVVFYLSKSHCVWRAMLALGSTTGTSIKNMFGEDTSTDAPLAMQKALSILHNTANRDQNAFGMDYLVDRVTTTEGDDWDVRLVAEAHLSQAIREASGRPKVTRALATYDARIADNPDSNEFYKPGLEPDFSNELDHWTVNSQDYGPVDVRVYRAADDKADYAIYRANTQNGPKAWSGTGEVRGESLTKLGIRTRWLSLHPRAKKPPIEHAIGHDGAQIADYDDLRVGLTAYERYIFENIGVPVFKV